LGRDSDKAPEDADRPEVRNIFEGESHGIVVQAGSIGELHLGEPSPPPVPRVLPEAPLRFSNRKSELSRLDDLITEAQSAVAPVVAVLSGMHGVGKSAIGSHWVHHMWNRFDGGTLYGDFSKYRHRAGVDVGDVLGEFIEELGTSGVAVPATLEERHKLFKRITFSRRLLVLLDDVGEPAQVRPLLPTGSGSVVIVTSNSDLPELLSSGAELIELEPLDEPESRRVLSDMAGASSVKLDSEPEATKELVTICAGLPIALGVCAGWIQRKHQTVSGLVEGMADERERLRRLSGGSQRGVQAVFDFAYSELDDLEALIYRRLGLHPGPDLDGRQAGVLADISADAATERLQSLVDTHLVEPRPGGRYGLHALIRINAGDCAARDDPRPTRDAAVRRIVNWFYRAASRADRVIALDRLRLAPDLPPASGNGLDFATAADAFAWFETERTNLIAVVRTARDREWDQIAWQLVEALWLFYSNRKHYADWIDAHEIGVACARRSGNLEAEGRLRATLARAFVDLGDFDRADEELERAEQAVRSSTNMRLRGSVREFVGVRYVKEAKYDEALDAFHAARSMFESFGGSRGVAIQDYQIGRALTRKGDPASAEEPLQRALEAMSAIDDQLFIGRILLRLGEAKRGQGCLKEAGNLIQQALEILTSIAMPMEEAEAHEELAAIAEAGGHKERAAESRGRAYLIYREMGHPRAGELVVATHDSPEVDDEV
jgi:tetratricopeptide (TPR) repeat protein